MKTSLTLTVLLTACCALAFTPPSACKVPAHPTYEGDTLYVGAVEGRCRICVNPSTWAQNIDNETIIDSLSAQAESCISLGDSCEQYKKTAQQSDSLKRVLDVSKDSLIKLGGKISTMEESQKNLKDSIAGSFKKELDDAKSSTWTWRIISGAFFVATVAEGYILFLVLTTAR